MTASACPHFPLTPAKAGVQFFFISLDSRIRGNERSVCERAGVKPLHRHARTCCGHPRLHNLAASKVVDGRDKPGHDAIHVARTAQCLSVVMPGHRRPKDGVLSHAYVPGIHVLPALHGWKSWMAPEVGLARLPHNNESQVGYIRLAMTSPAMTPSVWCARGHTPLPAHPRESGGPERSMRAIQFGSWIPAQAGIQP